MGDKGVSRRSGRGAIPPAEGLQTPAEVKQRRPVRGAVIRSVPLSTSTRCASVHDIRHREDLPHSSGDGSPYQRLDHLARAKQRYERQLMTWIEHERRTRSRIAKLELERKKLLDKLELNIRKEAAAAK